MEKEGAWHVPPGTSKKEESLLPGGEDAVIQRMYDLSMVPEDEIYLLFQKEVQSLFVLCNEWIPAVICTCHHQG